MFTATLLALTLGAAPTLTPTHLRCEYLIDPVGIDELKPRLSWIVESNKRGAVQSAYHIRVAASPEDLKSGKQELWDSGLVTSSKTNQIEYEGPALKTGQRVWWSVSVVDANGEESKPSQPAFWEVGIVNREDWAAQWIGMPDPLFKVNGVRPAPYLRHEFKLRRGIKRARAYVTAEGLYRLHINGHIIGKDFLTPGWTDFHKRIQYQTYDVTSVLRSGANGVGLILGDGWFCGHVGGTPGDNYGPKPMGLLQLEVEYTDGSKFTTITDGSWKASFGAIQSDDLLMGETYDATKSLGAWSQPGYDDSKWAPVDAHSLGDAVLVGQHSPTIQQLDEIRPKGISEPKPGVFVLDIGQNMVGWARLKVSGDPGTKVQMRFAEMLNPDGTVYTTNLRGAKATDVYTLGGGGAETYEPSFTFHGFRYVELTGFPGQPDLDTITGIVAGSNNPQTGWFQCSNELVNKLWHNIYWGERGNYFDVPTDCPQRDERLGWMGDAEVFCPTACYNNDIDAFMTKWTQDVVDAQSPEGGFSDVSPRIGDPSDGAPAWGDAGVIVPWDIYLAYGDERLLGRRYPAMKKWIEYIDSVNPNHIWINRSNNNFGDWLNVQDDTPRDVIATAYFAHSTELLAKSAKVLGMTADAEHYNRLQKDIKEAFVKTFVDADGKIKGDTQTDYVLALHFDLIPDGLKAGAEKRLVDHIVIDRKGHLSTGFVGVGSLNLTLTDGGNTAVAYRLLTNDTYPSWGYSIRQGATTIWERWDGWTKDKGFQDPGMNSFNHYSLGSVGDWMYRTVGGIALDPEHPGFEKFIVHPIPGPGVTSAKAALDSVRGRIESSWSQEHGRFQLDLLVPSNTVATVYIPASSEGGVKEGGKNASTAEGVHFKEMEGGFAVYTVGGGRYRFQSDGK